MPLLVMGQVFQWPPQVTGWACLVLIIPITILQANLQGREEEGPDDSHTS